MPPKRSLFSSQLLRISAGCILTVIGSLAIAEPLRSQVTLPQPSRDTAPPPSTQPLPEQQIPPVAPPPADLLEPVPSPLTPAEPAPDTPSTIVVERFDIKGSTVFSQAELAKATEKYLNRELSQAELLQDVPAAILALYEAKRYLGTDVVIPPQATGGDAQGTRKAVITVNVIERGLDNAAIEVAGTRRLSRDYIRSRIAIATGKPLNRQRLLEALQLLQLNPLLQGINAELSNTDDGQLFLKVTVQEAKSFSANVGIDNRRSPSVGSFRRYLQVTEANLLGSGDALSVAYTNTQGSNSGDFSYTLPINPRNGTINLSAGIGGSHVIEEPFDFLDIRSRSTFIELTLRQPLLQTPTQEFALGLTASRQFTRATLVDGEIPFPTRGSDFEGNTRVTALRFFQEWTQSSPQSVFAARSQFSLGIDAFGATDNEEPPDGKFFAWRGQLQWVRRVNWFAPDSLLVLRGDVQLADRALVPIEQFGLGGQLSVRGYRQDAVLGDSGAFGSVELRVPIVRLPNSDGLLQLAPFAEVGTVWNQSGGLDPDPSTLASVGLGLRFQLGTRLNARLDWGIPLISIEGDKNTWQESGVYFSVNFNFL